MSCRDIWGRAFQVQGTGRGDSDGGGEKSSNSGCSLKGTPTGFTDDGLNVGCEGMSQKMTPQKVLA